MRIVLPTQVPLLPTALVGISLVGVQLFQGTSATFSVLFFAYIMLSAVAFNLAGGLSRASGAYVFFYALLVVIFGVGWKAILGEPADRYLLTPAVTMTVEVASIAAILAAVVISRHFTRGARGFAARIHSGPINLRYSSLGLLLIGLSITSANYLFADHFATLISLLNQLNHFTELSIILATIDAVQSSRGRRSFNLISLTGILATEFIALTAFSKQGIFTPPLCWLLGIVYTQFQLRWIHLVMVVLFGFLGVKILAPYAQVGRNAVIENATLGERARVSYILLTNFSTLVASAQTPDVPAYVDTPDHAGYYKEDQGLLGRLSMLSPDDSLIEYSARGHYRGYDNLEYSFYNWIPHFLWPDKPTPSGSGNSYAHEVGGILATDDYSTGISFSAAGEGYHLGGFVGVLLVGTPLWALLFFSVDLVCGDTRRSPFGLLAMLQFAHVAPEGMLTGVIGYVWFGNVAIIAGVLLCAYFAPIIGLLLTGGVERHARFAAAVEANRNAGWQPPLATSTFPASRSNLDLPL